jgi:hypothetical protein
LSRPVLAATADQETGMTTVRNQTQQLETPPPTPDSAPVATERKAFVEPKISDAVDVLEATTFFQAVDSGATN